MHKKKNTYSFFYVFFSLLFRTSHSLCSNTSIVKDSQMFTNVFLSYICPVPLQRDEKTKLQRDRLKMKREKKGYMVTTSPPKRVEFRFETRGTNLLKIISGKLPANQKLLIQTSAKISNGNKSLLLWPTKVFVFLSLSTCALEYNISS